MKRGSDQSIATFHGAALSRRGFLATSGFLVVTAAVPGIGLASDSANTSIDASKVSSWFEIHENNTVTYRTGKCDFGQGTIYTAYPQIIAEELYLPFEAIVEVISGDTDRTPDGGITAGLLRTNALNLRKAAAYTREALTDLAAERLGVSRARLSIADGVISGGGKQITYGELVKGQELRLAIPVTGNLTGLLGLVVEGAPPLKPTSAYAVVGKSFRNRSITSKVTAADAYSCDVAVPGMLHGRSVHPPTLGSKLISVGTIDKAQTPNARVIVQGNYVGVVAPTEWEAIRAAQQISDATRWSEWEGLPGHEGLIEHFRERVDWNDLPVANGPFNRGDVTVASSSATQVLEASYFRPFYKHAPIGPSVAVADVRADGSVTVHTSTQNPQYLRHQIALMLGVDENLVVVRTYPGPGHYGRSNGGEAGAESEAVLLSRAAGKPVRLQWMRADDLQWSTQSHATLVDIKISLDANGRMTGYSARHHNPPMQDDRLNGALLAGLPSIDAPGIDNTNQMHRAQLGVTDPWLYRHVPSVDEKSFATFQIGQKESPTNIGIRDHSMRTPMQFQQNYPRELAITEAAALAGKDPLQFRIDHASEPRVIALLERLRLETGWEQRPSPRPDASASGNKSIRGQGCALMLRDNGYWACAAQIRVIPSSGEIVVERVTLVVDPGIIVNPAQLKRQAEAACAMGISQTLFEEMTFDKGAITVSDWASYPILTMAGLPEINVILQPTPEAGIYGQGSESGNALAAPAIAGAVLDATGKSIRRLPLRPDIVVRAMTA